MKKKEELKDKHLEKCERCIYSDDVDLDTGYCLRFEGCYYACKFNVKKEAI